MQIERIFEQMCPPPSETVYCTRRSCPSVPANVGGTAACLYAPICKKSRGALLVLKRTFRWIKVTLSEPASSIVVRSEHQFSRDTRLRLSLRKHIYELKVSPHDTEPEVEPCASIDPKDKFARYLGFIDLRPNASEAPLAMGLLVPPRRIRHDPYAFVATGEYGPIFGGHSFQSTVYSMHEPDTGGAYCGQACAMMGLAALVDRGARIAGSYTLTYLAKKGPVVPTSHDECVANKEPVPPNGSFKVDGLNPYEIFELFEQCETSPCHVTFPNNATADRLAERLLAAYLEARCPAIMFVDSRAWWDWTRADTEDTPDEEIPPHAVSVVGFSRPPSRRTNSLASLIVHDPGFRPYYKCTLDRCFEALKAYDESRMHIVFVADARIRRHAFECIKYLTRSRDSGWWRPYFEGQHDRDYQISLVHRDDLVATFFPSKRTENRAKGEGEGRYLSAREKLRNGVIRIPRSWYWCVTGYDRDRSIDVIWFFDAWVGVETFPCYSARLDVTGDVEFSVWDVPRVVAPDTPDTIVLEDSPSDRRLAASLDVSVITSSSDLPLAALFQDLNRTVYARLFDLFILRDIDIQEIETRGPLSPQRTTTASGSPDDRNIASIMAEEDNYVNIKDWYLEQCAVVPGLQVAAFATYFPDISSVSTSRRERVVMALKNTVRLALELKKRGYMPHAIVELVCGSRLDRCDCPECEGERIWEYDDEEKIKLLLDSLRKVITQVEQLLPDERFVFALELEPGETYVLRDEESLRKLVRALSQDKKLANYCGINVDAAHMRAAEVTPSVLEEFEHLLVHAHVCDLPFRMHTRDQPVGRWCPVDTAHCHHWEYLEVLSRRKARENLDSPLPFSGSVAIELEGCSRTDWIHQSIATLRARCLVTEREICGGAKSTQRISRHRSLEGRM